MYKKIIIGIFFLSICFCHAEAQRWKKYRYEFSYGLGATNFMGDIGAPEQNFITQYFWLTPKSFRPIGNVGLGYILLERVHAKANLHLGWLSGSDEYGAWVTRDLKFSSFILEPSMQIDVYLNKEKRKLNIYRSTNRFKRKLENISIPTYLFIGFGGVLVSTNLQAIETVKPEDSYSGETILGKKTTFTGTVPIGIGFRYRLSSRIYLGLEASLRYTLSDKIDNHIPTLGQWVDAYQFLVLNVNYKLKSTRSGLPRFKMSY